MKLQTINAIELSNDCSLKCLYCINRLMPQYGRSYGIMSEEVFERSLYWLAILQNRGTQKEVNLNGNGESLLDPDLPSRIRRVKDIIGDNEVSLCTNGTHMTYDMAVRIKDAGIEKISLSPHSAWHARQALIHMIKAGMFVTINLGSVVMSHNWAGQLEPENSIEMIYENVCDPLKEGRGYIQREGGLSPCCYDFRGLGEFGTVFNDDLLDRIIKPYSLCKTCHQKIHNETDEGGHEA